MEADGFIVENFSELKEQFRKHEKQMQQACDKALARGAMNIVAEAKRNLRLNGNNVTGLLTNSGKAEKLSDGEYQAGFFSSNGKGYAEYLEYGRRAGKMPPPKILEAWVYKRSRDPKVKKNAASIAFAIARFIAKHGTQPHPFFKPAVDSQTKKIVKELKSAAKRIVDKGK